MNYGMKEVFLQLLQECFLKATTSKCRPNNLKHFFFKCIHCNEEIFLNKKRLNKHRWDALCPTILHGYQQRMLPYPHQGMGQGKVLKMYWKGKAIGIEAKLHSQWLPWRTTQGMRERASAAQPTVHEKRSAGDEEGHHMCDVEGNDDSSVDFVSPLQSK